MNISKAKLTEQIYMLR